LPKSNDLGGNRGSRKNGRRAGAEEGEQSRRDRTIRLLTRGGERDRATALKALHFLSGEETSREMNSRDRISGV